MTANVKVKNNAGTEVIYNNVDTVVLPTSDGGTVVFKRWNGVERDGISSTHVHCLNVISTLGVEPIGKISATVALA